MELSFQINAFKGGISSKMEADWISNNVLISNYLYKLIIGYMQIAKVIVNSANAGIIINPSTGLKSTIGSLEYQFQIGTVNSLMNIGDTILVLNVPNAMQNSQGVFLDGALLKTNTSLFLSYTVFYTSTTVTITFNQAVSNGQVYQINLLQYVSI